MLDSPFDAFLQGDVIAVGDKSFSTFYNTCECSHAAIIKEIIGVILVSLLLPMKVGVKGNGYNPVPGREFLNLLHERADFQFEVICKLFIASGLCSRKLSALYWEDLNLETGLLHIRHILVKVGEEYVRQFPKTQESTRHILLPALLWICPNIIRGNRQRSD